MEIQVNGGTVQKKVEWAYSKFEQEVTVGEVFEENECIDTIGVTKGHGTQGVTARYGVKKLKRKTHRGLRRIGCIGAWHPAAVKWTVGRVGQMGYHSRTEINKKIYKVGKAGTDNYGGATDFDQTTKDMTPMGGFAHYGVLRNDYLMIKGGICGPKKRCVTLRRTLLAQTSRNAVEEIKLKFVDTSSKFGHGRFQSYDEKLKFYGKTKA